MLMPAIDSLNLIPCCGHNATSTLSSRSRFRGDPVRVQPSGLIPLLQRPPHPNGTSSLTRGTRTLTPGLLVLVFVLQEIIRVLGSRVNTRAKPIQRAPGDSATRSRPARPPRQSFGRTGALPQLLSLQLSAWQNIGRCPPPWSAPWRDKLSAHAQQTPGAKSEEGSPRNPTGFRLNELGFERTHGAGSAWVRKILLRCITKCLWRRTDCRQDPRSVSPTLSRLLGDSPLPTSARLHDPPARPSTDPQSWPPARTQRMPWRSWPGQISRMLGKSIVFTEVSTSRVSADRWPF